MNLFIKQKELNAQENDKYLAIQEFKCNVSPSNLDAEDVGVQSNDQTQQQIIQDKLEIVFDLSSHDSKNNNEVSNQLSDNSFINFKKGKSQRRSKGHSNGGAAESLIYSQSSCNVVNKKFESQRFSEPRFRENILKEVDLNIQRKSVDVQAKQSIKNENSNNNNNNNNETQTINRQPTQEINRLIQLDQSPKCSTYRRQSSIGSVWQVFVQLMKIVQKLRLKDQIEKISHFIGDKSHQKKDQINKEKMSKKKQIKFNEQLNQNNNIQIINQYQQQQKQLKSQINYAQPSFSFASFIYDSISILIAFLSFIYYSALLIIQPSLTNSNEHYRKLFCGFFIAFYVTDIIKELILIIFSQTQKSLSQIINCLKAYTRSQFLFDIVSLFSIIIIEIIHTDIVQNYNVAIIFVLFFLFFKFFTIYNKWINILNYFLYSQRLSTCLKIVKLLAQISFLLHTFTLIYYIIGFYCKDSNNYSWLNSARQIDEQNALIIYIYSLQSCYLQLFHQITYLPQTEYEIYFFFSQQFAFCLWIFYLFDQIFYDRNFTKSYFKEFTAMSKYFGEDNMGFLQKIELFNLIKVKKEKDEDEQNIQVYKQYSQSLQKHLQKYFRMHYFNQLTKQDTLNSLFSKPILQKCCKIVEEVFRNDQEIIYDEYNDKDICMYIILEGQVSLYLQNDSLSDQIFESQNFPKLIKNSLIGYSSFFTGMRKRYIYKAHDKVRLLRISREAFIKMLQKSSESDYQKFCEIKDRILFENNTELQQKFSTIHFRESLSQLCLSCSSSAHDISECDKCHFVMNKKLLVSQEKEKQVTRNSFERKSLKNINQLKSFNKMQIIQQRFLSNNKSLIKFYYSSYLQYKIISNQTYLTSFKNIPTSNNINNTNQAANSQSFLVTSDNQIQLNQSKYANCMVSSETHKNNSNKLNGASPNISAVAKDRSFSIQSLKNVQNPESNKSPAPESQFKNNSNLVLRQQQQPIQGVIQEESMQSLPSQKRSTIAQLYPEKIQSDLNHGINVNNANNIPNSQHYKTKIIKKFEDINDEIFRGESPISSLYNISRISNNFTPTSRQNIFAQQEQKQNPIVSKNDIIVLQVEENIPPNVYEFNLNNQYQGNIKNNDFSLMKAQDQIHEQVIVGPQLTTQNVSQKMIYISNLQNIQEQIESMVEDSGANSNNYLESTIFNQQRQLFSLDLDQMLITKNYFTDYNMDVILNYITSSKPLKEINGVLSLVHEQVDFKNKKFSHQNNKKSVHKR